MKNKLNTVLDFFKQNTHALTLLVIVIISVIIFACVSFPVIAKVFSFVLIISTIYAITYAVVSVLQDCFRAARANG